MNFKSLHPILWSENFDETIGLQKDEIEIMISKPNQYEKLNKIGFSGSFYFNVENADELWEDLKTKTNICYEIETFEWGMREFAIYDNNGYILQFGSPASEN